MRAIILIILLLFPLAEIMLLVKLADHYGGWVLVYLVVMGLLGLQLIREEKSMFTARMMQSLSQGGNPLKALMGSARNMVAGVLLLVPGLISDAIAIILLIIPMQTLPQPSEPKGKKAASGPQAANDDIIEGEFTHIREDLENKS